MESQKKLELILNGLEKVHARPHMYLSKDMGEIGNFLIGYEMACTLLLDIPPFNPNAARVVLQEEGLDPDGPDPSIQMRRSGVTEEEIVVRRLKISMEIWKRTLQGDGSST